MAGPSQALCSSIIFRSRRTPGNVKEAGFVEVDLVSHSGNCGDGEFIHSLNMTDIHTGWVETRAVLGKGQAGIVAAMEQMRQSLPFPLRGIVRIGISNRVVVYPVSHKAFYVNLGGPGRRL